MTRLSIIIPALNEADGIAAALASLADLRGNGAEIIVVDGGSSDATIACAQPGADLVMAAPRGRASQMNAGAKRASGDVLLFLHADCRLPRGAAPIVQDGLARSGRTWGRFDVTIAGPHPMLRIITAMMNLRSRLTGIATGDQAIFVRRATFEAAGGFPAIPLMEDIALSKCLKRIGRPLCLRARVVASGRRWETHGITRTILLMWRLRLAYFLGADPAKLARHYGYGA
jgi:rSAM/selenodomain-associated transferase 2